MSIQLTLQHVPETGTIPSPLRSSVTTTIPGTLLRECGLPLACVVQPFAPLPTAPQQPLLPTTALARCRKCGGYINPYCAWDTAGWACALCSTINDFHVIRHNRYTRPAAQQHCPELLHPSIELRVDGADDDACVMGSAGPPPPVEGALAYLVLLDVSIGGESLELLKATVQAAVEGMPSSSLLGIVTFADTVGLVDARADAPNVLHVPVPESGGQVLELSDVLPLDCLLMPVGAARQALEAAVEALAAAPGAPEAAKPPQQVGGGGVVAQSSELVPPRAFGAALQGALRYVAGLASGADLRAKGQQPPQEGAPGALRCAGVRLLAFLQGVPNWGPGALLVSKYQHPQLSAQLLDTNPYMVLMPDGDDDAAERWQVVVDDKAVKLYGQLAAAAAALGVCVDVYAVGPGLMALEYLRPLASRTGGVLSLYPGTEDAALPQDVYKRLTTPFAFDGLVRLRCPPELRVAAAHGHVVPDPRHENLLLCGGCTPYDCMVLDLEYVKPSVGFSRRKEAQGMPVLQLVFQYSVLVPHGDVETDNDKSAPLDEDSVAAMLGGRFTLERRLRICTQPLDMAREGLAVLQGARADAVATCLLQRVLRVASKDGATEARLLLRDWLVNLTARYNWLCRASARLPQPVADVTFESAASLQLLPRLVYALVRSPLLEASDKHHPDLRASLHHLWTALPPEELACAVYPRLASYADADHEALSRHSLSRAALLTSTAPLFLLDSYSHLMLLCTARWPAEQPFPPPLASAVRVRIAQQARRRQQTPAVKMLREGVDDTSMFDRMLLEDAHGAQDDAAGATSLLFFLGQVRSEAEAYIKDFPGHRAVAAVGHGAVSKGGATSPHTPREGAAAAAT